MGIYIANQNSQSEIIFGGYDSNYMSSALTWLKCTGDIWWEVDVASASYNGISFIKSDGLGRTAIIDTGTSYLEIT